jgi:hypothetical protein
MSTTRGREESRRERASARRGARVDALAARFERYIDGERESPRAIRGLLRRLEDHVVSMSRYVFDALAHEHGTPEALRLHDALAAAPADSELGAAAWAAAAACGVDHTARRAVALDALVGRGRAALARAPLTLVDWLLARLRAR